MGTNSGFKGLITDHITIAYIVPDCGLYIGLNFGVVENCVQSYLHSQHTTCQRWRHAMEHRGL